MTLPKPLLSQFFASHVLLHKTCPSNISQRTFDDGVTLRPVEEVLCLSAMRGLKDWSGSYEEEV